MPVLHHRCPKCNKQMYIRHGPHGFFFGCSGFPECKGLAQVHAMPSCPECGKGELILTVETNSNQDSYEHLECNYCRYRSKIYGMTKQGEFVMNERGQDDWHAREFTMAVTELAHMKRSDKHVEGSDPDDMIYQVYDYSDFC